MVAAAEPHYLDGQGGDQQGGRVADGGVETRVEPVKFVPLVGEHGFGEERW